MIIWITRIIGITSIVRIARITGIIRITRIARITRIIRITGIIKIVRIARIIGITRIARITMNIRNTRIIRIMRIISIVRTTRRQRQCPCGLPREVRVRRQDRPAGRWTGRIQQRTGPQRRLFYRYRERDTGSWRDGWATTQWISWWIPDRQLRHYHDFGMLVLHGVIFGSPDRISSFGV